MNFWSSTSFKDNYRIGLFQISLVLNLLLHNFSKALGLVSNSLQSLHVCCEAFSKAVGLRPLNKSKAGRK